MVIRSCNLVNRHPMEQITYHIDQSAPRLLPVQSGTKHEVVGRSERQITSDGLPVAEVAPERSFRLHWFMDITAINFRSMPT